MTGGLKTFSHLAKARRIPSDYEVATTDLHYYPGKGFAVDVPIGAWYQRHQAGSLLKAASPAAWDGFADPSALTYTAYTTRQQRRQQVVDHLFDRMAADPGYGEGFPETWWETLRAVFAPLRYPVHGLQMVASYIGSMAPASRLTIVCLFQAADEMRRIQSFAYRLRMIQHARPGFGDDGKELWQNAPAWQPWRRAIETLLVTYDWGEALVALNAVVKPAFDGAFLGRLREQALSAGDYLMAETLASLEEDSRWHRDWTQAFLAVAAGAHPGNQAVIDAWIARWSKVL
jgi:toluene monooxygenase system protein E